MRAMLACGRAARGEAVSADSAKRIARAWRWLSSEKRPAFCRVARDGECLAPDCYCKDTPYFRLAAVKKS